MNAQNKQQLQTLHALYPTREEAAAEVARLSAAAHLPKETEFFVSDIHGEFAAFSHILRNASGGIRELIDFVFEDGLSEDKKRTLASLVYYPEERVAIDAEAAIDESAYYFGAIVELVALAHPLVLRHTAERVNDLLPQEYAALIRALLVHCHYAHKPEGTPEIAKSYEPDLYANSLINSAIETGIAPDIIVALAELIQHLAVDHLHMVGDVYDRGRTPISSWKSSCAFRPSIFSGATTMRCGWARRWASGAASHTWCATARAMATSPFWKIPTASTCVRSQLSRKLPTPKTPAWVTP